MTETMMKKTRGRRRIPIQKIENKVKRSVTFSKRKQGLFKKASELATLCGSEIAVVVFSDAGKAFTFGHPSADSVVQRYVGGSNPSHSTTQSRNSMNSISAQFGCDNSIDRMGLDELILYSKYLQNLRNIVAAKATSMDCSSPYVSDQLFVQENSAETHSKYLEKLYSFDVERAVGDCQGMMKEAVDVVVSSTTTTTTTITNDCYNVQESSVDDVLQLDNLDLSKHLEELIDFDVFDRPTKFVGEGTMNDGYVQLASSSSYADSDVDAQWGNFLCDIQWEEDTDFLASFLHH